MQHMQVLAHRCGLKALSVSRSQRAAETTHCCPHSELLCPRLDNRGRVRTVMRGPALADRLSACHVRCARAFTSAGTCSPATESSELCSSLCIHSETRPTLRAGRQCSSRE